MMRWIVETSLRLRLLITIFALVLMFFGIMQLRKGLVILKYGDRRWAGRIIHRWTR